MFFQASMKVILGFNNGFESQKSLNTEYEGMNKLIEIDKIEAGNAWDSVSRQPNNYENRQRPEVIPEEKAVRKVCESQ